MQARTRPTPGAPSRGGGAVAPLRDMILIMNSESDPKPGGTPPTSGAALRGRAQGSRTEQMGAALAELDPDLLRWADGFIFGDVWNGGAIGFDERMMVAIVALASTGQQAMLRNYLHGAFQAGIAAERIRESLKMLVVYIGFPAAIAAMATFDEVRGKYEARPAP
jgi:4-carboxymuconolactone decarboxylase